MATIRAIASGNFSSGSTWNGGIVPSSGDEAVASGFNVTITQNITVISLRNDTLGGATAGGGFTFNTAGVILNATSIIPAATASTLITVTHTTGSVTMNIVNGFGGPQINSSVSTILYSGNGDLTITCPLITGNRANATSSHAITKSSSGTLTINGNVGAGAGSGNHGINSSLGNTVVVGNVSALTAGNVTGCKGIFQTGGGNISIVGNVLGCTGGTTITNYAIDHSSGTLQVNGIITGGTINAPTVLKTGGTIAVTGAVSGSTTAGITGTPTSITVIGDVTAATANGIQTSNAAAITITGKVTASPSASAVFTTGGPVTVTGNVRAGINAVAINTTGLVSVDGLLENTGNVQAVYSPRILIGTATTSIRYQTSSGATQLMYLGTSGISGQPTTNNVRFGTPFGVDNTFVGTCRIPTPDTVRLGAVTDDTTGTLLMTPDGFIEELGVSTRPIAVRLQNISTIETTGDQVASYGI